jgi:hypothetical protein
MKTKNLIYLGIASITCSMQGGSIDQKIGTLEKQVNTIIKNERERTEALNKLSDAVMQLERKLTAKTGGTAQMTEEGTLPGEPTQAGEME